MNLPDVRRYAYIYPHHLLLFICHPCSDTGWYTIVLGKDEKKYLKARQRIGEYLHKFERIKDFNEKGEEYRQFVESFRKTLRDVATLQ